MTIDTLAPNPGLSLETRPRSPYRVEFLQPGDEELDRTVGYYTLKPDTPRKRIFDSRAALMAFRHLEWRLGRLKDSPDPLKFSDLIAVYEPTLNKSQRWNGRIKNYVLEAFGNLLLAEVTPQLVVALRARVIAREQKQIVAAVMKRLTEMFREARLKGWIETEDNPMLNLPAPVRTEMPRVRSRRQQNIQLSLPSLEVIAKITALSTGWLRTVFLLIIFSGLRSQEVRALRVRHLKFFDGYVRIYVHWAIKASSMDEGKLKTASGRRHVDVGGILYEYLKAKFDHPYAKPNHLLVFEGDNEIMRYDPLWRAVHDFQASIGIGRAIYDGKKRRIEQTFAPHMFRHAAVALWIWAGMDEDEIQRQIGHSKSRLRTSLDIYGYLFAAQIASPYEWPAGDPPATLSSEAETELEYEA